MKRLRDIAILEQNVPGVMVSVYIPSNEITQLHSQGSIVDLDCKKLFSKVISRSKKRTLTAAENGHEQGETLSLDKMEHPQQPTSLANEPKFHDSTRMRPFNRYDSIIDRLERKYYSQMYATDYDKEPSSGGSLSEDSSVAADQQRGKSHSQHDQDDDGDDAIEEGADGESTNKYGNSMVNSTSQASAKPKATGGGFNNGDEYDWEDPFIDDSEMIEEVKAVIQTKKTKTKHGGFFVSSGQLEVTSPEQASPEISSPTGKMKKKKKKKKDTIIADTSIGNVQSPGTASEFHPKSGDKKKVSGKIKRKASDSKCTQEQSKTDASSKTVPKKKKKKSNPLVAVSPTADTPAAATAGVVSAKCVASSVEMVPSGSREVRAGTDSAAADATSASASTTATTAACPPAVRSNTAEGSPTKTVDGVPPRPRWEPSNGAAAAMLHFKDAFDQMSVKLHKTSNIPKSVESALHVMDQEVLRYHCIAELSALSTSTSTSSAQHPHHGTCTTSDSSSGEGAGTGADTDTDVVPQGPLIDYAEQIQDMLGGNIQLGKVRGLLSRVRLRDSALVAYKHKEASLRTLCEAIPAAIVPCPDHLQPAGKARALKKRKLTIKQQQKQQQEKEQQKLEQKQEQQGVTANQDEPDGGATAREMVQDPPMTTDATSSVEVLDASASAATSTAVDTAATISPSPGQKDALPSSTAGADAGAESDGGGDGSDDDNDKDETADLHHFKWYCKWDAQLKVQLLAAEHALQVWVDKENNYRDKLTNFDKKHMSEEEIAHILEKEEIKAMLQRVGAACGDDCVNADVDSLRRVISIEKKRLKKLEQARGGNKASSGAAGISAAASSSPTGLRQGKGSPNLSRASSNAGNERQEGSPTKKARTGTSGSDGSKCGTSPKVSKGIKAAKGMQESQQREIMDAAPSPSSSDVEVVKVRHSTSGPEAGNSDDEYAVYFEELPK